MNQRNFKAALTIFCMMATSVVTIATSKARSGDEVNPLDVDSRGEGIYYVASNCPRAIAYEKIKLEKGVITEPQGLAATDFGLPGGFIYLEASGGVSGLVDGNKRFCREEIVNDQNVRLNVYNCVDETGYPVCKVTFERESVF